VKADPYPYYAELRREAPVFQIEGFGAYAVSRYEDVSYVLMHPEVFSSIGMGQVSIRERTTRMLIGVDPPEHTRMRSLVNRSFTPRMVADLEPRIREVTSELVDRIAERGEMDLIDDLAMPLPVTIIAEILGVDPAHKDDFKRWSDQVLLDESEGMTPEEQERIRADMQAFQDYFANAADERRREPRNDMISDLVRAETEQQALSSDEVLAFIALLLIAGNETTTNLLGNAMRALLDNPDQMAMLHWDPALIPNAVEEALRFDAPVQFLFRRTTKNVKLAGGKIPEGALVLPVFGSANRDERRYADSERFDVTRDAGGHLAFGHGIHFCLGAPLARLEAAVALEALLTRFTDFEGTDGPVELISSQFLRGPKHLKLSYRQAEARVGAQS
jgi:cytochrome P450